MPASFGSRSGAPDKSQRSRSVSFSPDRARVRGRSPAFTALAATFENPGARNLSTPPPMIRKLYPKSGPQETTVNVAPKSAAIAALTASFEKTPIIPRSLKGEHPWTLFMQNSFVVILFSAKQLFATAPKEKKM